MAEHTTTSDEPLGQPPDPNPDDMDEPTFSMEPDDIISNPDTMEVHHHPDLHHRPKKWKEYFLEFLMIFLAVTLGFFAENIREHISDKEKTKVFAASLYQDFKTDSVALVQLIN